MEFLNTIASKRFKVVGAILLLLSVGLYVSLKLLNYTYVDNFEERIFIFNHYLISFSLVLIAFSGEGYDDERVQKIRYVLLRLFFALVIGAVLFYATLSTLERVLFSVFSLIYIVEGILIAYIFVFRICLLLNPDWVFKETKNRNLDFILLSSVLVLLLGWVVVLVALYKI
jgi:hypothetical protein